jgi:hypothetical protein
MSALLDRDPSEISMFLSRMHRPERSVLAVRVPGEPAEISAELARSPMASWSPPPSAAGSMAMLDRGFAAGLHWSPSKTAGTCRVAFVLFMPDRVGGMTPEMLILHECLTRHYGRPLRTAAARTWTRPRALAPNRANGRRIVDPAVYCAAATEVAAPGTRCCSRATRCAIAADTQRVDPRGDALLAVGSASSDATPVCIETQRCCAARRKSRSTSRPWAEDLT